MIKVVGDSCILSAPRGTICEWHECHAAWRWTKAILELIGWKACVQKSMKVHKERCGVISFLSREWTPFESAMIYLLVCYTVILIF